MSGKKSCEVARVLDQTESVQNDIFNSYKRDINKELTNIDEQNREIDSKSEKIKNYQLPDVSKIEDELPEEAKELKERLKLVKQNNPKIVVNTIELKEKLKKIESELVEENQKSKKIRNHIYNNPHYCDTEYHAAIQIRKRVDLLREDFTNLKADVSYSSNNTKRVFENIRATERDIDRIISDINKFKKQAEKIKTIRNEANALKIDISDNFGAIVSKLAIKFMNTEYLELQKDLIEFNSLDNAVIIDKHSKLLSKIILLKSKVDTKYNRWLSDKNISETLLSDVSSKGFKEEISFIEDLFKGKKAKKSKLDYYSRYNKSDDNKKFNELIDSATIELKKEEFEKCNNYLKSAEELYNEISNKADKLREKLESEAKLTLKMRKIMQELGFNKTELNFIDGDVMKGFYLNCKNGDIVNFEEIRIDDDGGLIINLDHIERTSRSCGVRWESMKKSFNENGIPLTDVRKNGHSVIYKNGSEKTTKIENLKGSK